MLHVQGSNVFANARLIFVLLQELLQSLAGVWKQSPEDEIDGSSRAFDVQ
jgi:hypothetical protein